MSDVELCREVYRRMYRAMIEKDIPALSKVLDESFVLVHMTGMRQPKAAFLKAVSDGTLNYYRCEDVSVDAVVRGDAAELRGESRVSAAVFGGGRHDWRLRQDMKLTKRGGVWRILRSEASTW